MYMIINFHHFHTIFSKAYRTFSKTEHILDHIIIPSRFKMTHHSEYILWKQNNSLIVHKYVEMRQHTSIKKKIKEEIIRNIS